MKRTRASPACCGWAILFVGFIGKPSVSRPFHCPFCWYMSVSIRWMLNIVQNRVLLDFGWNDD